MRLIAHRGNVEGPNPSKENHPLYVESAISLGFDVEIDVWWENDHFYLGHDNPQYPINPKFLDKFGLWIHAKNLSALRWLTTTNLEYFWHQEDNFTLTSHNYIWTYPGKELTQRSVCVMPEWEDSTLQNIRNINCYAICSDYVGVLR
jgi:hypothetical protein